MGEDTTASFVPGLQGIVAAETRLSKVDGSNGELVISGFPIEELATKASFEEVVYLLWHDVLPGAGELDDFRKSLAGESDLSGATLDLLRAASKELHSGNGRAEDGGRDSRSWENPAILPTRPDTTRMPWPSDTTGML